MVTQERLKEVLDYNPETGHFVWKRATPRGRPGAIAGRVSNGYRSIRVDGVLYYAHHLAWVWANGYKPSILDHINGDRADNRLSNLREATPAQNACNRSKTGFYWHKAANKWCVEIAADGVKYYLGLFADREAAKTAYNDAARELHGKFFRSAS